MTLLRPAAAALTMILALGGLGGCKQEPAKPAAGASTQSSSASEDSPISQARLVLPAVKGNPGAAYFTVTNDTSGTMALASVAIDGTGKAEMHQTISTEMTPVDRVDVSPGTSISFEPGQLHVMVFDLGGGLRPGGTSEMTVTLADGRTLKAPLKIEAAGAAAMGEMDHGDAH